MESDIYGVSFYISFLLLTMVNFGQRATMQHIVRMFGQSIMNIIGGLNHGSTYFFTFFIGYKIFVQHFLTSQESNQNFLELENLLDLLGQRVMTYRSERRMEFTK